MKFSVTVSREYNLLFIELGLFSLVITGILLFYLLLLVLYLRTVSICNLLGLSTFSYNSLTVYIYLEIYSLTSRISNASVSNSCFIKLFCWYCVSYLFASFSSLILTEVYFVNKESTFDFVNLLYGSPVFDFLFTFIISFCISLDLPNSVMLNDIPDSWTEKLAHLFLFLAVSHCFQTYKFFCFTGPTNFDI